MAAEKFQCSAIGNSQNFVAEIRHLVVLLFLDLILVEAVISRQMV